MSPDELMEVAERVLAMAAPEEQVEVVAAHSRDTEVRAYDGEIEAFTSAESAGFGVRVIRGHRQGFAYAGTLDADVVAETLGEARDNAAFSTVDEFTGLVEPDGVAEVTLHLYDEALAGLGPDRKIELALELERLVCAGDPRILGVEMAEYADSIETAVIASTTGIRSISRETGCSLAAYSLAGVDDDVTTGFGFSVGRGLDDLDLEDTARQAVERAVRMLGAGRAPSRRLTVVFDPWVTAQFLSIVGESFSGSEVLKGRSFLADRVGASIAPPTVTLVDDPTDGRWPSATPSDAEGLATRRNVLIDAGVVSGFVHDGYSARALGARSTGSAVRHGFKSTPGAGTQSISLNLWLSAPEASSITRKPERRMPSPMTAPLCRKCGQRQFWQLLTDTTFTPSRSSRICLIWLSVAYCRPRPGLQMARTGTWRSTPTASMAIASSGQPA